MTLLRKSKPNESRPRPVERPVKERVKQELEFLLSVETEMECEILTWWKSHSAELPLLAKVARQILSACATSVTSERIFSISGHIVSKKRTSLLPEMVNMLVCLAFNNKR